MMVTTTKALQKTIIFFAYGNCSCSNHEQMQFQVFDLNLITDWRNV